MFKNKVALLTFTIISALIFSACAKTDVIKTSAISSFDNVLQAMPENINIKDMENNWVLEAPDKSAKFIWAKDYDNNQNNDISIEFDAEPFIKAGLDVSKLNNSVIISGNKLLTVGTNLSDEKLIYSGEITPLTSFEQIANTKRSAIGYHASMDHFNVDLGNGNKFEWAKDMANNDKDIVFVLDPQVFIDAGVDPQNIDGWVFAKVETMDDKNKTIQVDKLLKAFNLK